MYMMLLDVATCFPTPIASPSPDDDDSFEVILTSDVSRDRAATLAARLFVNHERQEIVAAKQDDLETRLARLLGKQRHVPSVELRDMENDYYLDLWVAS